MWNYKEGFSTEENAANAQKLKSELENLVDLIDEIKSLTVTINPLPTGNRDILLDSLFESEETLQAYILHPEHVRVGGFVRSVTQDRASFDYYVE